VKAIDLFAGWGGFTCGAELAGVDVVWAANHWPLAVRVHALNHPRTAHACQDLHQADWSALPRFDLLLASPACQGHSTASQPRRRGYHDSMRSTAFAVTACADVTRPKAIIVENVPSFQRWALYTNWLDGLRVLGYHVTERVMTATDSGVPQLRKRLVVTATLKPRPLRLERASSQRPAFGPCIDLKANGWRDVSKAPADTRARLETGLRRHGPRLLVQQTTGHRGLPLSEPIRTITTQDHWLYVDGDRYRSLTMREYARGQGFPESYTWPDGLSRTDVLTGIGNAIPPPMARDAIRAVMEVV
jgi:DNA (cytosine-5)-methyltransferase 1